MPAVSTIRKIALLPAQERVDAVPGRPRHVADDRALFAQQPIEQRGLPHVRAADDGHRNLFRFSLGHRLGTRRQPLHDVVQQIARPFAVLRGNLDDGFEAQPVELGGPVLRSPVVGLVDGDEHRNVRSAEGVGDLLVAGDQAIAAIYHEDNDIRLLERLSALDDDELVERVLACPEEPAGIDQRKRVPSHSVGWAFVSRVVPAMAVTIAFREPVMRLNSVDLPTFGRPTRTTVGVSAERFWAISEFYLAPILTA